MRMLAILLAVFFATPVRADDAAALLDERGEAIALQVAEAVGIPVPDSFARGGGQMLWVVYATTPREMPEGLRFAAAVYRLTREAIAQRRPTIDNESQWLIEGLSYAVVEDVVRREMDDDAADALVAGLDPAPYADLRPTSNLAYWAPGPDALPPLNDAERRLAAARLAFAFDEARRLTAEHGTDVIAEVLGPSDRPTILDQAAAVTGQNLRDRLRAYQAFDTVEQGLRQEVAALKSAREAERYDEALGHALRTMEIARDFSPKRLALLVALLHEAGRDDEALALLAQRADVVEPEAERAALLSLLMDNAANWERTDAAYAAAERVLAMDEDHPRALALRMRRQLALGKLIQAKVTAKRIVDLGSAENTAEAQRVIDEVSASVGLSPTR